MATKRPKADTSENLPVSQIPPTFPYKSWNDHPIAVAAISAAATLSICILFFTEVVIPTQTASLTNQLADLPSFQRRVEDAEAKAILLEKHLAETQRVLLETQVSNLFIRDNPYPAGLGQVKIGDHVTKVPILFSQHEIRRNEDNGYSVNLKNSPFTSAYFMFTNKSDTRIFLIEFSGFGDRRNSEVSHQALKNKLTDALGTPKKLSYKDSLKYFWRVTPTLGVEIYEGASKYSIYSLP